MFSEIKQFQNRLVNLTCSSGTFLKSAMYHVEMAEKLIDIDNEMSAFRLITAEEEAATAILLMLKEHRYDGSSKLNKNNHLHKQCLYPYVASIAHILEKDLKLVSEHPPVLEWVIEDSRQAISLGFRVNIAGQNITMMPTPPLNFSRANTVGEFDFGKQLITFLAEKGFDDAIKHLKENTNLRNKLLYSDGKNIPNKLSDNNNGKYQKFAGYQLKKINVLIAIYFMTAPYAKREKAKFLNQTLDGYLKLLEYIKGKRL